MATRTIEVRGIEFKTGWEALQWCEAVEYGKAVRLAGRNLVIEDSDFERLEAAGVEFAVLGDIVMPDGQHRMVTVPIN
ncbi:MAG: hypothetical protein J5J06_13855 [Phycisphaerae bacterium]|nr:hypothetical protein [Phycisphaerae bacterium]